MLVPTHQYMPYRLSGISSGPSHAKQDGFSVLWYICSSRPTSLSLLVSSFPISHDILALLPHLEWGTTFPVLLASS